MATQTFDVLVIGGGINGAAVARDAAGRGLKVMLAEKGDYARATSSASSKLIHGGLRYLEQLELGLVRESLRERADLLGTAPHLVTPLRFLLPIYGWQRRSALLLRAGLALYNFLGAGDRLPRSGRLDAAATAQLPLTRESLKEVLHYHDCQTDDARLVLAVLLDARARGADILNYRSVTAVTPVDSGYGIDLDERGMPRTIEARFVVNAAGPWAGEIDKMCGKAPPQRFRLVRGSHIVLRNPDPSKSDAYLLQDEGERVIFVIPWIEGRFLLIGTTDVPHHEAAGVANCSDAERDYLLNAYNRYFAREDRRVSGKDILHSFAGVRVLEDRGERRPSRFTRRPWLNDKANGAGGLVSLYGGKLTTHRSFAERVMEALGRLGAHVGNTWTQGVPLHGGSLSREALPRLAEQGPEAIPVDVRHRWASTYGDRIETLFENISREPALAEEIAPGVTRAELEYGVEMEDARTAEDFLLRRTKLHLLLDEAGRGAVANWFAKAAG
jgi:glycerol-3-phosphate dehydrogenase